MAVKLYEGVELIRPAAGLEAGAHGVVLDLYEGGRFAEVEFLNGEGDTVAVEPVETSRLRVIADAHGNPLLGTPIEAKA